MRLFFLASLLPFLLPLAWAQSPERLAADKAEGARLAALSNRIQSEARTRRGGFAFQLPTLTVKEELKRIAERYPALSDRAARIVGDFDACALGEGWKELQAAGGIPTNETSDRAFERNLLGTETAAVRELDQWETFVAPGSAPEPMGIKTPGIFLAANPRYRKEPIREYAEGWKVRFQSLPKSSAEKEVVTLDLPASWNIPRADTIKRDVPVMFSSNTGPAILTWSGPVYLFLSTELLPPASRKMPVPDYDEKEIKRTLFSKSNYLSSTRIVLANRPTDVLIHDPTRPGGGRCRIISYSLQSNTLAIHLEFVLLQGGGKSSSLDKVQAQYGPLCDAIAGSLAILPEGK